MKKILLSLLVVLFGAISSVSFAAIYQWTDKDGKTNFTDKPRKGAKIVNLRPVQTYNHKKIASFSNTHELLYGNPNKESEDSDETKEKGYTSISLTQPENDTSVRANNGNVTFVVSLNPGLQQGHEIGIYLDGKLSAREASTTITVENIDRGTHRAVAKVLKGSTVLKSSPSVTFTVQRHSILHGELNNMDDAQSRIDVKAYIGNSTTTTG